ncbi:hypothetical protein ACFQL1_19125 [Halomicroarcula sp. GCM10025709]|uniref:hypothetical protein n=1 Tax=Haloarcula TaxID=2237 RepID=UPI0024C3AFA7|nr:hypothetical protein [Halomicroarcula sp. YJ-61-S]
MAPQTDDVAPADDTDSPLVTALDCGQERTVFTEDGNTDGWISTDLTVDLRR